MVSDQHLDSTYGDPDKTLDNSKCGEQTGFVSTWSILLLTAFLANPGIWQSFYCQKLLPFCPVKLLRFYYRFTLRLPPFWLRLCSVCEYSFGTWACWNQAVSVEKCASLQPIALWNKGITPGTNCLWPSPSKTGDVSLELYWFGPQPNSFGNKSSFWSGS